MPPSDGPVREAQVPRLRVLPLALLFFVGVDYPLCAQISAPLNIAFVADGAGNYQLASKMLRTAAAEAGAPIEVDTFVWSHGYKMIFADQMDLAHAKDQGRILAAVVAVYHQQHSQTRIHLVGHSAGSMVVLEAAANLPPATVNSIVLLAPSVSSDYDIRPALRCVREGVEVYYSSQDWVYLGFCTNLIGCADRHFGGASGRYGFSLLVESPRDELLLERLHQHPWQPDDRQLGNDGGHYGAYQIDYLKARVLPVLLGQQSVKAWAPQ
jgi:pimeloyl-ACP methyl ester carboxylesterase